MVDFVVYKKCEIASFEKLNRREFS